MLAGSAGRQKYWETFILADWPGWRQEVIWVLISEINRVQCGGRPPGSDTQYVDVYNEKPVRAVTKVIVPVKQHPKVSPVIALRYLTVARCLSSLTLLGSCWDPEEVH